MALYYVPAIGSYFLAKCIYLGPKNGGRLFIQLGAVTVGSFALLFLPFLPPFASPRTILDPVTRIFPFSRGLFEDKVANFWCFSNVVLKWRNIAGPGTLVKLSTLLTAAGFAPGVMGLLKTGFSLRVKDDPVPSTTSESLNAAASSMRAEGDNGQGGEASTTEPGPLFSLVLLSMLTSSISFFFFSFQVHEKTILVPLLPLALIMVGASGSAESMTWELGMLANNVAVFSMWPLVKKDGLGVQYVALTVLWNGALGYTPFKRPKTFFQFISLVVSVACITLHLLEFVIQPPARYPDIFPVLNVLISTPVFGLVWLWSIKSGIEVGWAVVGLGGSGPTVAHSNQNSQPTSSSTANIASPRVSLSHLIHGTNSPFSPTDSPISPLSSFNRRTGTLPGVSGLHRPGFKAQTWSNASVNSNAKTRSSLGIGPERNRPLSLDCTGRAETGGDGWIQGLGLRLDLDGRGEKYTDRQRSRGQSLSVSDVRKRVLNLPKDVNESLPLPSD